MAHDTALPAPQPLLLDAAGHTCVAWWHAPAPAVDRAAAPSLPRGWLPGGALPLAVVLATSWGEEDMSAYDGQRALAVALAASGLPTLRFEWPDTGDSSAETGSTSVADALAAFDAAAAQARALSGCDRLAFVGLRLGALLAAHAAAARADVTALVGLLPVASGRAFVREQRMLGAGVAAAAAAAPPGAAFDAAALPVPLGGFSLPVRQLEALAALRWPQAVGAVRRALLLAAPETPGRGAADALEAAGVGVSEWSQGGLARALAIAHQASLAPQAIDEIARWLQQRGDDGAAAPAATARSRLEAATGALLALSAVDGRAWMSLRHAGAALRERVVRIATPGAADAPCLVGVVAERAASEAAAAARGPRRGIVLLSSGRERRVGPHRAWVAFARHRAALGDVVLRVDVAGIGDSDAHGRRNADGLPEQYDPRAAADVARALAWLRREHGVGPCSVMGICSGAFNAWRAALEGADLQQVVLLNPLLFHVSPGMSMDPMDNAFGQIGVAAAAGRSLLDPARWRKLLSGRANVAVISGAIAARARHALRLCVRGAARLLRWPLRHDLAVDLAHVVGRGVAVDFVFSFREPGLTLLREEAGRRGMRLERDSRVKVCVIAHADHTFAGAAARTALYARLDSLLLAPSSMTPPSVVSVSQQPATARS
jgi:alpha/beta superfamily hydrolase